MEILEEIGEISLFKDEHEKQVLETLENKGFQTRKILELQDENVYIILVKSKCNRYFI